MRVRLKHCSLLKPILNSLERSYYLIIAFFFTLLIGWGSFLPSDEFEAVTFSMYDKIVHTGGYTVLAFSWFMAIGPKRGDVKTHIVLILGTSFYGIIIEIFQGVLSAHRKADVTDILANFIGVMLAFILFYFISHKIDRYR